MCRKYVLSDFLKFIMRKNEIIWTFKCSKWWMLYCRRYSQTPLTFVILFCYNKDSDKYSLHVTNQLYLQFDIFRFHISTFYFLVPPFS